MENDSRLTVQEFLIQPQLAVVMWNPVAIDEDVPNLRPGFERVAIGCEQIGDLPRLERADEMVDAEDLRRADGNGSKRLLAAQAVGRCESGMERQVAHVLGLAGSNRDLHAGIMQQRSEERRVGKEGGSRWGAGREQKQ